MNHIQPVYKQLINDMGAHFRARMNIVVSDLLDTMRIAGLPSEYRYAVIIRSMLVQVAVVAIATGATKVQFLRTCEAIYDDTLNTKP